MAIEVKNKLISVEILKIAYDALKSLIIAHINNKSNPHGVTASQVGAVPTSRTVNGKALSGDIILTSEDISIKTDNTLSISGAVADAKATGDTINNVKNAVQDMQDYIMQLTYIEEVGF